ncbi:hypothetical protein C0989_011004 [Termitomyces sp. Mn162]|nr:hypothetical protein C0989_011004 [Termitomyces sp. Mn162]
MSVSTQELENPLQNSTSKISSSTDYGSISERLQPKRRSSASPLNSRDTIQVHEETSLLYGSRKQTMTPLPWGQVLIVLLLQVCEPLTSMSISPYVNQVCPI